MAWLTVRLSQYFESISHGLDAVLPPKRLKNKPFLQMVFQALKAESHLTQTDLNHLETLTQLADNVIIPNLQTIKALAIAEAYLIDACPLLDAKTIKEALNYLFLLLAGHQETPESLITLRPQRQLWRIVQTFDPLVQPFITDWIDWMENKQFSARSQLINVREFAKLSQWMQVNRLYSLDQLDNRLINDYLEQRVKTRSAASCQRCLSSLKSLFYYYKDKHNGEFVIPTISFNTGRIEGVTQAATSDDIKNLWQALEAGLVPTKPALMLVLIMGHGLPLKALPLLKFTAIPGQLAYLERSPCRQGERERLITLPLDTPWLAKVWEDYRQERGNLKTVKVCPYVFTSGYAIKRGLSVSLESCQQVVQQAVKQVLGYAIPVNHLERGAFKAMAGRHSILQYMALTTSTPKTRLTRMMVWLANKSNQKQLL